MQRRERDKEEGRTVWKEWSKRRNKVEDGYNEVNKHLHEPPTVWTSGVRITQGLLGLTRTLTQKAWDILNMTCQMILCIVELKNLCLRQHRRYPQTGKCGSGYQICAQYTDLSIYISLTANLKNWSTSYKSCIPNCVNTGK